MGLVCQMLYLKISAFSYVMIALCKTTSSSRVNELDLLTLWSIGLETQ